MESSVIRFNEHILAFYVYTFRHSGIPRGTCGRRRGHDTWVIIIQANQCGNSDPILVESLLHPYAYVNLRRAGPKLETFFGSCVALLAESVLPS